MLLILAALGQLVIAGVAFAAVRLGQYLLHRRRESRERARREQNPSPTRDEDPHPQR